MLLCYLRKLLIVFQLNTWIYHVLWSVGQHKIISQSDVCSKMSSTRYDLINSYRRFFILTLLPLSKLAVLSLSSLSCLHFNQSINCIVDVKLWISPQSNGSVWSLCTKIFNMHKWESVSVFNIFFVKIRFTHYSPALHATCNYFT